MDLSFDLTICGILLGLTLALFAFGPLARSPEGDRRYPEIGLMVAFLGVTAAVVAAVWRIWSL